MLESNTEENQNRKDNSVAFDNLHDADADVDCDDDDTTSIGFNVCVGASHEKVPGGGGETTEAAGVGTSRAGEKEKVDSFW